MTSQEELLEQWEPGQHWTLPGSEPALSCWRGTLECVQMYKTAGGLKYRAYYRNYELQVVSCKLKRWRHMCTRDQKHHIDPRTNGPTI